MRRIVVRCVSSIDDSSGMGRSAAYDRLHAVAFVNSFALLIARLLFGRIFFCARLEQPRLFQHRRRRAYAAFATGLEPLAKL